MPGSDADELDSLRACSPEVIGTAEEWLTECLAEYTRRGEVERRGGERGGDRGGERRRRRRRRGGGGEGGEEKKKEEEEYGCYGGVNNLFGNFKF